MSARRIRLLTLGLLFAAVTVESPPSAVPIYDIQYTTDPSGNSPLLGQVVTITGVVTGESYAFGGSQYYVQDAPGAWNGILVYDPSDVTAEGDSITFTGTVDEYGGMTRIVGVTSFQVHASLCPLPGPAAVTTGAVATGSPAAESYEGVLVRIAGTVVVTNDSLGAGEWEVNDGSGPCRVDDAAPYYYYPELGDTLTSVTAILHHGMGQFKLEPRLTRDIVQAGPYTSIQWIQHVRVSDLMRTDDDETGMDLSYAVGDTVAIRAVTTAPTGLFYAGSGVKFVMQDVRGGAWSGMLVYKSDSTGFPDLLPGHEVAVSGYIMEFSTGCGSHMTELIVTGLPQILSTGHAVPEPVVSPTGILLDEWTAEQFEGAFVRCTEATVVEEEDPNGVWAIDDDSGLALVDDDSDNLWGGTYTPPPAGTIIEEITGWLYHHGYYSTLGLGWYYIEPLGPSSIVVGGYAAPMLHIDRIDPVQAQLWWASISGATHYRVYRAVEAWFAPGLPWHVVAAPDTFLTITEGVGDPSTDYYFLVRSVFPGGESGNSNRVGELDFETGNQQESTRPGQRY